MKKIICLAILLICFDKSIAQKGFINTSQLLKDLEVLSADSMEGRVPGSEGSKKARNYILNRFKEIGLKSFNGSYESVFLLKGKNGSNNLSGSFQATNIIGYIPGKSEKAIVITAHYDHVGVRNGEIYNGADDNASGVGALLALATYYKKHSPNHTLIFAALDAEEVGLQGAGAFLDNPPVALENIVLNINMDMLGINDRGELYASGTYHYPLTKEYLLKVANRPKAKLVLGHDSPDSGHDDWTHQSDHFQFHKKNIPYIYFGVEDHPHYHKPTDKFSNINKEFYPEAAALVLDFLLIADKNLK